MKLQTWEVAARLQVTRKTVQRYEKRGLLSATRNYRGHREFDAAEVERLRQRLLDGEEVRTVDPLPAEPRREERPVRRLFDPIDTDEL